MPQAELIALLEAQREALVRHDADGATRLDALIGALEAALAALAARMLPRPGRPRPALPAGYDSDGLERIRRELQINQDLLQRVASRNRQGLNALFGEPALYGR